MLRGSSDLPGGLTRRADTRSGGEPRRLPPYLVLLRVGFALPVALLRQRYALTAPFHPYLAVSPISPPCGNGIATPTGRYVFCGTFRQSRLNAASRTLSGTLLSGVRTFLSPRPQARGATVRSSCQHFPLYSRKLYELLGFQVAASTHLAGRRASCSGRSVRLMETAGSRSPAAGESDR